MRMERGREFVVRGAGVIILFAWSVASSRAEVSLPAIFSDHTVLQKSENVPIWGKAASGEAVTVSLGGQTHQATASEEGRWQVLLNLSNVGPGPFELTVSGQNTLKVSDVLVGEVWLASGQSNMEWPLKDSVGAEKEIKWSGNLRLREFQVEHIAQRDPGEDCKGKWVIATPRTTPEFSGLGYYFGKRLQKTLNVPVGIIDSSWGGTPVETWIPVAALQKDADLAKSSEAKRAALSGYTTGKDAYVKKISAWLQQTGRQDRPTSNPADFTGDNPVGDWGPVQIPGVVGGQGLPGNGVIWLRREVEVPAGKAGLPFSMDFDAIDGFETVYLNGQQLSQTTYENYRGTGYLRWLFLPANLTKPGKNVVTVRLYAPSGVIKFPKAPRMDSEILSGTWMARAEYELPALPSNTQVPQPPSCPPREEDTAGYLYNGLIHPLVPYALKGVIWSQGESNAERAFQYRTSFPLMIESWRKAWNKPALPFYFCQLANFMAKKSAPVESSWAELREAQDRALSLPETGGTVLIDLGESDNVHYRQKREAAERLANIALAETYGKDVPWAAPAFLGLETKDGKAMVRFDSAHGKLTAIPLPPTYPVNTLNNLTAPLAPNSPGSEVQGFAICGTDRKWVWADAKIEGDSVAVWSPKVTDPVAVRYAWADNPTANLFSEAGLPVSPFRTDDFPVSTQDSKY